MPAHPPPPPPGRRHHQAARRRGLGGEGDPDCGGGLRATGSPLDSRRDGEREGAKRHTRRRGWKGAARAACGVQLHMTAEGCGAAAEGGRARRRHTNRVAVEVAASAVPPSRDASARAMRNPSLGFGVAGEWRTTGGFAAGTGLWGACGTGLWLLQRCGRPPEPRACWM